MDPRYPVGKLQWENSLTEDRRKELIRQIDEAPAKLRSAVNGLNGQQLDTPYRDGGWTVRQVVHHLPDSHMNAYVRFKLALTEQEPVVKTYEQERWAELVDSKTTPVETSVTLLESLHARWVNLLRSMAPADFSKSMKHPELGLIDLNKMLQLYAWHGRHHVAHITSLRERKGWK